MSAPAAPGAHLSEADVHDYVDGKLDPAAAQHAYTHLLGCARCAGEVQATQAILGWARQSRDAHPAPAELWPLVVAATTQYGAVQRLVLRRIRGPLIALALLLVALTAVVAVGVTRWRVRMESPATLERRLERARQREATLPRAPVPPAPPAPGGPPARP